MYSLVIGRILKVCKGKVVYVGGLLTFSLGMGVLATIQEKWAVLVFSASAGVMYATLYTMPFLLVAQYHSNGSVSCKFANPVFQL
jgi:solute carrier family 45 protein 1/2/4